MNSKNNRPNPDELLKKIKTREEKLAQGKLKIFFGCCPGVGKTFTMLEDAKLRLKEGIDVVAGIVETHNRSETAELLASIPQIPPKITEYREVTLKELDIDAAIARKPAILLIDELAHTNAPNSRHPKRWNDVKEVLEAGIDVYTTLNVQHLESLNDIVESITGVSVKETIPDSIFDTADDVILVDIDADEILHRLKSGKVYLDPQIKTNAAANFFKKKNLIALRELALRRTAERVDAQMQDYALHEGIPEIAARKILVCIGPNSLSAKLIRSTKRMASEMRVPFVAVYVENSRHYKLSQRKREIIESYFRMVKRNGGSAVILYGENAAEEIISFARSKGVSRIIVGKSNRKPFSEFFYGSLAEKIIKKSGAIDVYVVTDDLKENRLEEKILNLRERIRLSLNDYTGGLLVVILCTAVGKIFDKFLLPIDQIMIYLIGAVLVAARFGYGSSILFSFVSVTAFNFFFVEPLYSLSVVNSTYWLTFLVMLITSLIIATQASRLRWQAFVSRKREGDIERFYTLTQELASTRGHKKIGETSAKQIAEVFDAKVAIWLANHSHNLEALVNDFIDDSSKEKAVAMWCFDNNQIAGKGTDTMPSSAGLYLPLIVLDKTIGVMGIYPKKKDRDFTSDEKSALETFASLISSSLERASIAAEAERTKVKAETEELRNILLSSVSHDLRTPLASIIGASESIASNKLKNDSVTELAKSINSEASRLAKIVKNLLDVTSIESGNLQLNKQPYYLQEIIGSAILRLKDALLNYQINIACENDLPMIEVDGVLIEQVITNLLENAIKYTPEGTAINISVKKDSNNLLIIIEDNGPGISTKDTREGYGLGLVICHGIIKAHQGSIITENSPPIGTCFSFTLPL